MEYRKKFVVEPGSRVRLDEIDPSATEKSTDEAGTRGIVLDLLDRLQRLQYLVYAENKRSVLVVLQAMDGGGKDGTIKHVMGAMNPQSAYVHAFKEPTYEEAAHDFLWRAHRNAPGRGEVAIFNRSHYEDVLVVRVHPELLGDRSHLLHQGRELPIGAHIARLGRLQIRTGPGCLEFGGGLG